MLDWMNKSRCRRLVASVALSVASLGGSFALAADGTRPPALMLADTYRPNTSLADYWVSEKYDGVRAYWDGRALWTRRGEPINAPDWFTRGWPRVALDGELWSAHGQFDRISAAVRRQRPDDAEWRKLRFMVFDLPGHADVFDQRLVALRKLIPAQAKTSGTLTAVAQRKIASDAELQRWLRQVVKDGGEGLMLHRGSSFYRAVRSDDLLKLKLHEDAEATVIGYLPGKGKYAEMVGALQVRSADGREFRIGSGLTDALRRNPPAIGTLISYRYRGLHESGLPRFPTYFRVRADLDVRSRAHAATP